MTDVTPKIGDFGFDLVLTVVNAAAEAVDISGATTKQYIIRKPDGAVSTETVDFDVDGTDGKLRWTVPTSFLDQVGKYEVESLVASALFQYRSTEFNFVVGSVIA